MWIEAISKYHGTHLQAPNFALKLTARKFDASKYAKTGTSIDLSSVKHMINAAEPVTEESIEAFCKAFCPFGFDRNVIFPTYGLAEHTVFVCSGGKQRLTVSKQALEMDGIVKEVSAAGGTENGEVSRLIGCGYPAKQNVDVKIVSPETFGSLGQNKVGEIWIRSDSKAAGYHKKPFETKRDFCAMLGENNVQTEPNDDNAEVVDTSNGYLRSGDLGFLHNGELFICGRIKDLIIVGGRNYYPQDIEATAEASDNIIRPGCSAAFTVDPISGEDEEVALVLELREMPDAKVRYNVIFEANESNHN
jgi:acyl-CoA synthetase (AMP-forming)/AMP-acid ligase II